MNKIIKYASAVALTLPLSAYALEEVVISGAIEAELGFGEDFAGNNQSDTTLATVELGIDAAINDRVSGHVLLLHEEDDTPLEVDEGTITVDLGAGMNVTAGQMYVPFGNFETNLVSDPLTLEIGETRESAIQLGFEAGSFHGAFYIFNGDTIETSTAAANEDTIENFGFSVGTSIENDNFMLDLGLDYINSIDSLNGALLTAGEVESYVSGLALHAIFTMGAITAIFEHVAADDFQTGELVATASAAPSAMNLEVGYDFGWGTGAVGFQSTDEALALELPETAILVAVSKEIFENTSVGVEVANLDDYETGDGGSGESATVITVQLATEF